MKNQGKGNNQEELIFNKENYKFLIIGVVAVIIGFIMMVGGKAESPDVFNPEVFSTMRITIAPTVVLIGFGIVMYGIMKKTKEKEA